MSTFARAQDRWEQSWVNGPPEDPDAGFIDEISEWPLTQLTKTLDDLRVTARYPEPGDKISVIRRHIDILLTEIGEREEEE